MTSWIIFAVPRAIDSESFYCKCDIERALPGNLNLIHFCSSKVSAEIRQWFALWESYAESDMLYPWWHLWNEFEFEFEFEMKYFFLLMKLSCPQGEQIFTTS